MVFILTVSRVSTEDQSQGTQDTSLTRYASKYGKITNLSYKISAFQYKEVVKFHGEILEKIKEMKQENQKGNTEKGIIGKMISGVSGMLLGEQNYKIIFTVPNRFSRSVYAAHLFFEELAKLSIKVEFHFCEDPDCNFTFESSESSIPEKFWDAIKAAQASSEDKSRTAVAAARAKRKHKEDNENTGLHSWGSVYNFIKLHLTDFLEDTNLGKKGFDYFDREIQRTLEYMYDFRVQLTAIKYYRSMILNDESEDIFTKSSNIQCDECKKWRQVSDSLYREYQNDPGKKFVCSYLVYCKCSYPMVYEDDPDYSDGESEGTQENDGLILEDSQEDEDVKVYYVEKILESKQPMNGDQKMYLVKWEKLRKNNPAWHTEAELKSWGLSNLLELWEGKNKSNSPSVSKRARY